jgi:hypothetical protein
MAISVGASAQKAAQTPIQAAKQAARPQPQANNDGGATSKTDLAPGLKQAAQIAAGPTAQAAAQAVTAVGALVNTKA